MTPEEARRIIQSLADGYDPLSGEQFPPDSVLQHPDVIRALCTAALALQPSAALRPKRLSAHGSAPANQGKPWTALEDKQLCDAFDAQTPIKQLATQHQRTFGAIESRLARLGKEVPPPAPVVSTRTYPPYAPRSQPTNRNASQITAHVDG